MRRYKEIKICVVNISPQGSWPRMTSTMYRKPNNNIINNIVYKKNRIFFKNNYSIHLNLEVEIELSTIKLH